LVHKKKNIYIIGPPWGCSHFGSSFVGSSGPLLVVAQGLLPSAADGLDGQGWRPQAEPQAVP